MNAETEQQLRDEIARLKERVRGLQAEVFAGQKAVRDAEAREKQQADETKELRARLRDAAAYYGGRK